MPDVLKKLRGWRTILTALSGLVATAATAYLQENGVDLVLEPEHVAGMFILVAQIFQRLGTKNDSPRLKDARS